MAAGFGPVATLLELELGWVGHCDRVSVTAVKSPFLTAVCSSWAFSFSAVLRSEGSDSIL